MKKLNRNRNRKKVYLNEYGFTVKTYPKIDAWDKRKPWRNDLSWKYINSLLYSIEDKGMEYSVFRAKIRAQFDRYDDFKDAWNSLFYGRVFRECLSEPLSNHCHIDYDTNLVYYTRYTRNKLGNGKMSISKFKKARKKQRAAQKNPKPCVFEKTFEDSHVQLYFNNHIIWYKSLVKRLSDLNNTTYKPFWYEKSISEMDVTELHRHQCAMEARDHRIKLEIAETEENYKACMLQIRYLMSDDLYLYKKSVFYYNHYKKICHHYD